MAANPDTMIVPQMEEPLINFKAACKKYPVLGSFQTMSAAATKWKSECTNNKVHNKRVGLRHVFLHRGYWTTESWIYDYIDRISKN